MTQCPANLLPPQIDVPILIKAPWEQLPFTFDWTDEMQAINSSVGSSFWVLPATQADSPSVTAIALADDVTVDYGDNPSPTYSQGGTSQTANTTTIMLADGTDGQMYLVQNCMTTLSGLKYARQFWISCQGH